MPPRRSSCSDRRCRRCAGCVVSSRRRPSGTSASSCSAARSCSRGSSTSSSARVAAERIARDPARDRPEDRPRVARARRGHAVLRAAARAPVRGPPVPRGHPVPGLGGVAGRGRRRPGARARRRPRRRGDPRSRGIVGGASARRSRPGPYCTWCPRSLTCPSSAARHPPESGRCRVRRGSPIVGRTCEPDRSEHGQGRVRDRRAPAGRRGAAQMHAQLVRPDRFGDPAGRDPGRGHRRPRARAERRDS